MMSLFKDMLKVEIPHLEVMVRDNQPPFNFYTLEIYMAFHSVLIATILRLHESLEELRKREQSSATERIFNVEWPPRNCLWLCDRTASSHYLRMLIAWLRQAYCLLREAYCNRWREGGGGIGELRFQGVRRRYNIADTA